MQYCESALIRAKIHIFALFLNARFQCSRLFRNCVNIKPLYGRGQEERRLEKEQTTSLNCGGTLSPGHTEYNCRKWFSYTSELYLPPAIDPFFKFKNHCSLLWVPWVCPILLVLLMCLGWGGGGWGTGPWIIALHMGEFVLLSLIRRRI
jgi:hypothetical protein